MINLQIQDDTFIIKIKKLPPGCLDINSFPHPVGSSKINTLLVSKHTKDQMMVQYSSCKVEPCYHAQSDIPQPIKQTVSKLMSHLKENKLFKCA